MNLGKMDHYTLIVENAEKSANFHINVLGFKFLRIQGLNTGTVAEGQVDMRNYILQSPGEESCICVITQGLNENTIFSKYLKKYGEGVHHIGYRVNKLEDYFTSLKTNFAVKFTSERTTIDPLTGLHQVFIAKEHAGYFIELIERPDNMNWDLFVDKNMADLASTMQPYVKD